MNAAKYGHLCTVQYLHSVEASVDVTNNSGWNVLILTRYGDHSFVSQKNLISIEAASERGDIKPRIIMVLITGRYIKFQTLLRIMDDGSSILIKHMFLCFQ